MRIKYFHYFMPVLLSIGLTTIESSAIAQQKKQDNAAASKSTAKSKLSKSKLSKSKISKSTASKSTASSEETKVASAPTLDKQLQDTQTAIDKFKKMGVGVAPFEKSLQGVKDLIKGGKSDEAKTVLQNLNSDLADQQKRFYANKIQSWQSDKESDIIRKKKEKKNK